METTYSLGTGRRRSTRMTLRNRGNPPAYGRSPHPSGTRDAPRHEKDLARLTAMLETGASGT